MTDAFVALCADEETIKNPDELGLSGENFAAQHWLRIMSEPEEARRELQKDAVVQEVWVASCSAMAPINLAAAIKRDRPDRTVCMLAAQGSGSLFSRSHAAGIDASLSRQAFVERYLRWKREHGSGLSSGVLRPDMGSSPAQAGSSFAGEAPAPFFQTTSQRSGEKSSGYVFGSTSPEKGSGSVDSSALPAVAALSAAPSAPPVAPRFESSTALKPGAAVRTLVSAAPSEGQGFLLPVVSGSGGAGKSVVAALCALYSQLWGYRTLLLDFDLQFGDEDALLGMKNPLRVEDIVETPVRVSQLQGKGDTPALLAAPKRLEEAETIADHASTLLDTLLSQFEVVVANTGGAWAEQHAVLLERGSRSLFLVDQRSSSLRACKRALDLCSRCSIATTPFLFAVNRCAKGVPFTSIDVSCALGGAHVVELREGGRDVEELLGAGMGADLIDSRNDFSESVERMLRDILPGAAQRASRTGDSAAGDTGGGKRLRKRRRVL